MTEELNVLVIAPRQSSRSKELLEKLAMSDAIKTTIVDAVMLQDDRDLAKHYNLVDFDRVEVIHGRSLSAPEIGCTLSHNRAREIAMSIPSGAVILEDDAVIPNLEEFVEISSKFLQQEILKGSLLNLYMDTLGEMMSGIQSKYIRRLAPSPLAVGYAITSRGASRLLKSNRPVSFMGDWPPAKLRYFTVTREVVAHGNGDTPSFLGPTSTRRHNKSLGIEVLLFRHFFTHKSSFTSLMAWLSAMYFPRLRNFVDRIYVRLRFVLRLFLVRSDRG